MSETIILPTFNIDAERAEIDRRVEAGELSTAEGQKLVEQAWAHYMRLRDLAAQA